MRLIHCIGFFYSLAISTLASQSSSVANAAARSSAAQANWPFYTVCLADINTNLPAYNSYMIDNNMELPQAIGDYYFHLANLPNTADLEEDIASNFPFTHFQTFITKFPWYSSMLQKASVSTIYLPQDFVSGSTATGGSQVTGSAATNAGETTVITGTSTKNEATSINPGYFALFLVLVGGFLA